MRPSVVTAILSSQRIFFSWMRVRQENSPCLLYCTGTVMCTRFLHVKECSLVSNTSRYDFSTYPRKCNCSEIAWSMKIKLDQIVTCTQSKGNMSNTQNTAVMSVAFLNICSIKLQWTVHWSHIRLRYSSCLYPSRSALPSLFHYHWLIVYTDSKSRLGSRETFDIGQRFLFYFKTQSQVLMTKILTNI